MGRKALFFDIDGTLVTDDTKRAPDSAVEALKATRAAGNLVIINSGRVRCILEPIQEVFEVDGLACGCGTQIIMYGDTVFESRLPLERANQIKKLLIDYQLEGVLEAQDYIYFPKRPYKEDIMYRLLEFEDDMGVAIEGKWQDESYTFEKFCLQVDPHFGRSDMNEIWSHLTDFDHIDRGRGFYECVPLGCTKGTAVHKILDMYDISSDDTYVFGDSMNDLGMFDCGVKHRIAMGYHDTGLEAYATMITKNVEDDGIAYAMEELGLI